MFTRLTSLLLIVQMALAPVAQAALPSAESWRAVRCACDLAITSATGDVAFVAPEIESGGQTTLSAEQGDIALLTTEDSAFDRYERREEDLLWWNSEDRGSSETTRTPTRITADGGLEIVAGGQVIAEYVPTGGDFEAGIAQLAAAPGLEWMGQLQEMDNVAWQQAQTAFEEWNYEDQGLTEAGALLVTLVTSYVAPSEGLCVGLL